MTFNGNLDKSIYDSLDEGHLNMPFIENLLGKDVYITISKRVPKRSIRQNNYKYAVLIPCIKHFVKNVEGRTISTDEANAFLYTTVLQQEIQESVILGQRTLVLVGKKMGDMTTEEFNEAIEQARLYLGEHGYTLPEPTQDSTYQQIFKKYYGEFL